MILIQNHWLEARGRGTGAGGRAPEPGGPGGEKDAPKQTKQKVFLLNFLLKIMISLASMRGCP